MHARSHDATFKVARGRTVALGLAGQQADLAHGVGGVARQHVAQHAEDGAHAPDAARPRHHAQRDMALLLHSWAQKPSGTAPLLRGFMHAIAAQQLLLRIEVQVHCR
jgi:hypothetical protein